MQWVTGFHPHADERPCLLLIGPALLGLLVLTFVLVRVLPNDPSAALAGEHATPQQIASQFS